MKHKTFNKKFVVSVTFHDESPSWYYRYMEETIEKRLFRKPIIHPSGLYYVVGRFMELIEEPTGLILRDGIVYKPSFVEIKYTNSETDHLTFASRERALLEYNKLAAQINPYHIQIK
jgi:hypothetical protein